MDIRCKASKRFLCAIDIENYTKNINKLTNAKVTLPIRITIPCPRCHLIEEYEIYIDHIIHLKSYSLDKK